MLIGGDFSRNFANTITMGFVETVERDLHGMDQTERDRLENSAAGQAGNNVGMVAAILLPGPGGKIKVLKRIDESVRGTKGYAKSLFRNHAGSQPLKTMRDRGTGRITGVRTADGSVIYRPKGGRGGVTANVEVINANGIRVNIHIQP